MLVLVRELVHAMISRDQDFQGPDNLSDEPKQRENPFNTWRHYTEILHAEEQSEADSVKC
jgi:hypothetical protein